MKIAIYGVSRAGKNYLIERVVKRLNTGSQKRAFHLEGSTTLNILAKKTFDTSFTALAEEEKDRLRREFTKLIWQKEAEYEVVFVDGHYAFIDGNGFRVVFTEEDRNIYDTFFYLDTSAEMIVQFSQNSQGDKKNSEIVCEEVRKWKSFEKDQMTKICKDFDKELIILDKDTTACIEFINSYVSKQRIGRIKRNRDILESKVNQIANSRRGNLTILLDADGTLIPSDSAETMAKFLDGINVSEIKPIFKKYKDYCFSAFCDVAKYYSKNNSNEDFIIASKKAANEIEIRDEFIQLLREVNANFIIVTAGFSHLWNNIIKKYNLDNVDLIAGNTLYDDCIIGQSEKGFVVDILKRNSKYVICFGDALVDKDMFLKSDMGYLIVNEREKSITPHLENDPRFKYVAFNDVTIESMQQTTFGEITKKIRNIEHSKISSVEYQSRNVIKEIP